MSPNRARGIPRCKAGISSSDCLTLFCGAAPEIAAAPIFRCSSPASSHCTSPRKRYPRRATVSTNRGLVAESPRTSRILFTAVFRLWSKSTKVSAGHSLSRNSSRVTTFPARSSSMVNITKGWSCSRIRRPCLRSSRASRSASNNPKRAIPGFRLVSGDGPDTDASLALGSTRAFRAPVSSSPRRITDSATEAPYPNADVTDARTKEFDQHGTRSDIARLPDCSVSLTHQPLPPIRVLIADDSAVMRTTLARMLEANPLIRVCGTARNGQEVVEKTKLLQPDGITLDVEMPLLNGVEALKRIMSECPCPVIMFSSATREGAEVTLEALSAGAFDYLPKVSFQPCANTLKLQHDLIEKIEAASHSHLSRKTSLLRLPLTPPARRIHSREMSPPIPRIVVLATSTGGPQALQGVLSELPGDLPLAMIVVQHMPLGFT